VSTTGVGLFAMLAPIGIAMYMGYGLQSMRSEKVQYLFWTYAALTGLSIASVSFIYTAASIFKTFFITASVFGAMSIYGHTTSRDLTSLGSFLMMGLFGIVIASIVNIFFASPALHFALSFLSVVIFVGLTAYDTQKIKEVYYMYGSTGEASNKLAVMGAFTLYLDFINLFFALLRFFGVRRND
jgi:FtsH-binding integral membrane protein